MRNWSNNPNQNQNQNANASRQYSDARRDLQAAEAALSHILTEGNRVDRARKDLYQELDQLERQLKDKQAEKTRAAARKAELQKQQK
jgi:chromosome segregation ATPase